MKTVKILSLTLVMSICCAGMTFAQQQNQNHQNEQRNAQRKEQRASQQGQTAKATAEERATKEVEMMKKSLNLNSDQVTKMQAVQTQFNKDQEQARTSKKGTQQDMKAKRDAYDSQVKSILTPEQYQKYQDMKKGGAKKGQDKGNVKKGDNGQWKKDKKDGQNQNK